MTITDTNQYGQYGYGVPSYQTQNAVIDEPAAYGVGEDGPLINKTLNPQDDFAEPVYRDVAWAIMFLAHLGVMIYLAVVHGSFGVDCTNMNTTDWKQELEASIDDDTVLHQVEAFAEAAEAYVQVFPQRIFSYVVIPCAVLASVFSYAATAFWIPSCPTVAVQSALLGSVGWTIILTVFTAVATHFWWTYLMSAVVIAVVIYYVRIVWNLIPFAAINLQVSLKGISANWGMYVLAFLFSAAGFVWTIFWIYVAIGVLGHETITYNAEHPKNAADESEDGDPQGFTFFLLLVSFYWTSTVLLVSTLY
jgi:hypothetical protein